MKLQKVSLHLSKHENISHLAYFPSLNGSCLEKLNFGFINTHSNIYLRNILIDYRGMIYCMYRYVVIAGTDN